MRKLAILASLSVAAVFSTSSLSAQAPHGFYINAGGGYGGVSTTLSFEGASETFNDNSGSWTAGLGWRLNGKWAFGVEWDYAKASCGVCEGAVHQTNTFYMATATLFPAPSNGLFVKAGLGYGTNELNEEGNAAKQNGFSGGIGFGYNWPVGKGGFMISPFATYVTQFSKTTYTGDIPSGETGKSQILMAGLTVGYKH